MPRRDRDVDRRATLFAREELPRPATERRDAVAERLAAIVASGSLDGLDVVHWDKRVPAASEARERSLVAAFREWAADADVDLAPCFGTRRCHDGRAGEVRTELVLPVLCLAVYEDDELVAVAPRATDDGVVTVGDCLARLGADSTECEGEDEGEETGAAVTTAD